MASDQFILKEDGFLNIGTQSSTITYHSSLNVILVFNRENEVKVLDVHSTVILKSCKLSEGKHRVRGRYLPLQEKILFWDNRNLGLRGDYNGVLLLDTILQTPVPQNDDIVRLEMLLSEAILFQQSLQSLEDHGVECPSDVSNELLEKIKEAHSNVKKSIKAQRWNTVCIELPYSSLKLVANNVVFNLKQLERHIPALAIASAINERLTDLLVGSRVVDTVNSSSFERCLMYSEHARRQTFEKWPHMDYKWALPDQMAQAGFYHQPSATGEDRAMCFTCNVCLVCWEKTDEPWSEHERHSPNCPFVKGEYTQNVPLSVTYATSPAIQTDGFSVISNTDHCHIMCTSDGSDEVTIWSVERQLRKMHTFQIQDFLKDFLDGDDQISSTRTTAMSVLPMYANAESSQNAFVNKTSSISPKANILGSKFVVGVTVNKSSDVSQLYLCAFVLEDAVNLKEKGFPSEDTIKTDFSDKIEFEKDSALAKLVSEENFDSSLLKLKLGQVCPWKVSEDEKSFYLDFDDNSTQVGIACKIIEDTEKALKEQDTTKVENLDSSKMQKIVTGTKPDEISCRLISCVAVIPPTQEVFTINDILSVNDGKHVLVKLLRSESFVIEDIEDETLKMEVDEDATTTPISFVVNSQLQVFEINEYGLIEDHPLTAREFDNDKTAREICTIPKLDNNCIQTVNSEDANSVVCLVCMDGTLELLQLNSLSTIANVCLKSEKIVSATYCKSLERLCGCTENGSLIFYALRDTDPDSTDEMMDDDNVLLITSDTSLTGCEQDVSEIDGGASASPKNICMKKQAELLQANLTSSNLVGPAGDSAHSSPTPNLLAYKNEFTISDLQSLYSLTLFDEMLTPFVAEVPGCWNELVQAQKQRRHPQHLRPGDDTHLTKTWRLHNDATTWDEHTIELTLVKPSSLGHIDLKFSLYQQCPNPPAIQVTLLKQNTSGFGYRMKSHHTINVTNDSSVDDNIEFNLIDNEGSNENPVLTEDYLQAHNAEILAGPIELSSCMDLCDQGGLVTLTSPKLFKTRARNFLLHIKTMVDPSKDGQGKTRGCDWLHEISITVRSTKTDNKIINDRMQRFAMLESNGFLENLLKLACDTSKLQQNISIDILIWICSIRLTRFRSPKMMDRGGGGGGSGSSKYKGNETPQKSSAGSSGCFSENSNMDMATQQKECVAIVEQYLKKLIMSCIINGDRTLAHKAVKFILIVSEGVRNLPNDVHQKYSFDASLRIAIVSSLPFIITSKYSSAVRWFTFLISATSSPESHVAISECCVKLLMNITGEINKRWNLFDSLLGSRYGLNGFPFEPDIFDMELPPLTRSNSTPNTLANIIKSNPGLWPPCGLEIKKLSSIDGIELRSFPHLIKRKGISNQVRGLLEVEPLHFTCLAASEATRIENMDALTSSTASNITMEEIVTSTPLYNNVEGFFDAKKDADKDNMNDDIMNNVKNILVDKFVNSALKKYKMKDELVTIKPNGVVESSESFPMATDKTHKIKPKTSAQYQEDDYNPSDELSAENKLANRIKKYMTEGGNCEDYNSIFSWHKLLSVPPKQMVVVDRIHSGARRYVVIDFGSPVLLTDMVIPACDELASLFIDIWCLNEDTDSTRLVATQDIGVKTLVLSDLQPPPICRYMKITIIGRYGMSATRCKIPIGYFYGHVVILENDAYSDPLLNYVKANPANISGQIKALKSLYDDVHCRYSLSSSKLIELLTPILNSELCNIAHMHAYINKLKDDDNQIDNAKIVSMYDECISLQHQLNIIRNVIDRLDSSLDPNKAPTHSQTLASASRDKLRTLSESLVEILLHFTIEYGAKNVLSLHSFFNIDVANTLFNTLVVSGDAHIQLATCSLLVRMCCFQSWWGDFLANIFCTLYSSQNTRLFPQDRVFFLLSYLGRKSIMMGACRSIVIDAILKTLAKLLAPISPRYNRNENLRDGESSQSTSSSLWSKSDLQLITWLLLFLSVCLDGSTEKKDKSSNRWEFMSCEADISKSRPQSSSSSGKTLPRCFKKRIIQQNKYNGISSYSDWSKKMSIFQSEFPEVFMELIGKSKPKINKHNAAPKPPKDPPAEPENSFDQGLKSTKIANLLIVIRGLIGLILEMDFTCNMDLFLLTCKVIARLVSACKPSIQLSKVITSNQLEQLIRLAVWNDQQQPWAVHTITCLLQDLLDADKNFKETFDDDNENNDGNLMEGVVEIDDSAIDISESQQSLLQNSQVVKDISYADTVKYGQLPSLIECEDAELDEFLHDFDIVDRGRNLIKKDNLSQSKNSFNFFCKSVSSALDSRLDYGLDTNVEILIRRLTMTPSLDLYDSLPQISTNEMDFSSSELLAWPENITLAWSGTEYNSGQQACEVFKNVFDNIFADLHLQDTWVHLEQLLQMWLTLNSELSERPGVRKIAFGTNAVQGLLSALAWHSDIKLRTWGLGFHCLTLACHLKPDCEGDNNSYVNRKIDVAIIKDENFEKMLLRFFSGYGMSSSTTTNRCAGPTICKYLHELLGVLSINATFADPTSNVKRKLKDTLLNVVLQLVQPGGAISNQQGPIDAQSQLVRDLMSIHYDKADLNVAMSIIESVSFLVYNSISNSEKILCQRSGDSGNTNNTFGSLFATVLGSDNSKQNTTVSDSSLIVSLLKLSASLVQTEIDKRSDGGNRSELSTESQTDEIKAEQQNSIEIKTKVPCVADTVLRHFPTMKRLLGSLSHCNSSSFSLFVSSSLYQINITEISSSLNEPQTTADAVFHLLMLLCTKASQTNLVIAPIYQYLESNSSPRNILPRLQLSEPFLWYVLKVLETPAAVGVFSELGGMKILCQNLIKCNKVLMNMQPGLISLIMQHLTKSSKIKCIASTNGTASSSKKASQSNTKGTEGAINFAPFCTISSENSAAQPADVLIQTPIASHRRARTPAWSYMFYPNESYVDLTLTLPTAIMLMEIQIQPHLSSLASCPSAVAVEISRDCGLGPIPFGQAHTTVGMTFIRLKLAKPEIASSIVLRLYRPKDSSSIGLTQISVLGTTIFNGGKCIGNNSNEMSALEDDSFAKTGVGWIRILARCFSVAMFVPDNPLANAVVSATAEYPGFLEACCTLLNIMPLCSNIALQNLETVLLKLGTHNRTLSLNLVHNLLSGTMPQVYRLCNEAVCDLLYDLCTKNDAYTTDRVLVLLEWIVKVHENFDPKSVQHINPQSGLLKVISSILWTVHSEHTVPNLTEIITDDLFEVCFRMIENSETNAALKTSFDSLLCSFCYIRPELFSKLLTSCGFVEHMQMEGMTDDTKEANSSSRLPTGQVNDENLSKLFENISLLSTLSAACQSRQAVQLLIESKLARRLAQAVHELCCSISPEVRKISSKTRKISNCSLTDSDKAENVKIDEMSTDCVLKVYQLPEVLDFFSECCAEGQMRDWLGSYQGSIFWKPLLELLCNHRPVDSSVEPLQQHFIRIERSTINFFSRVTACHPKNQENLTTILISVIKKPQKITQPASNTIISGFTRRLVLQLLLESEKILVSVRSKMTLQKRSSSMYLVNNHPSKRTNAHHLLFYLSSHTKCQDLLQNCISIYSNILPSMNSDTKQTDPTSSSNVGKNQIDNHKELLDMGFRLGAQGMEFLSVVAGVTAKDKRLKDVKNQAAALKEKDLGPKYSKLASDDFFAANLKNQVSNCAANCLQFQHNVCPDVLLTSDTSISQILALIQSRGHSLSTPCLELELISTTNQADEFTDESLIKASNMEPLPTPLQRFSSRGGLSLLAHYLPTVFPENSKANTTHPDKEKTPPSNDWVKVEPNDEIYEDLEDTATEATSKLPTITSVPQHSLAAFGLFLRLPAYSDVLLRDKLRAQCLLRLVLGVTGDGEGNDIYSLSLAPSLPTLPFEVFRQLLDSSPLTTDDGVLLRRMVIEVGAMHLVLNCLGIFTHQSQNYQITGPQTEIANGVKNPASDQDQVISDDKSHVYWAKGTGFGTGSTQQSWDVEQALLRQKSEEEHVTVLLQVLSSYINPGDKVPKYLSCDDVVGYHELTEVAGELPLIFLDLLQQSCLIPALSSYLRNDSVLDITRHIPLYRSILQLLRALALCNQLMGLLQPKDPSEESTSIASLLVNMKTCVDTYAKRLKVNKKSNIKGQTQKVTVNIDDGDDEGLALLIPDIQETTLLVQRASNIDYQSSSSHDTDKGYVDRPISNSIEQRYLEIMKKLQFDTYEMIVECENGYRFVVSHHFENNVRTAGDRGHPSRVKRLAQETVTLSTSLPLSYSSSVFVRCDTDRLDIMKVLITGPADTPYANGCFEFDVYFPPDYPNSPMLINLETTGRHTVRFNPNLYNDGKVCLSVLNTWHGRPEEKWNAQTSSFLQVLVSIQSLILVPEPYFNEPGFERSRGTPSGTHCSREYNSNIYQACVRWAMLEQIRNPSPCFKEVIHTHFWIKRHEICAQIENWINELNKPQYTERSGRAISFNSMVLRRQYKQLREELARLPVPEGLEDLDSPFNPITSLLAMPDIMPQQSPTQSVAQQPSNSSNSVDADGGNEAGEVTTTATTTSVPDDATSSTVAAAAQEGIIPNHNQNQEDSNDQFSSMSSSSTSNWGLHTS